MKILWLTILLSFAACNDRVTVEHVNIETVEEVPEPAAFPGVNNSQLLGIWTEGSTENATFAISNDSILYVEDNLLVPYFLAGDSITIKFPTHTYNARIGFREDTLVFIDEYGESNYWPFKN